MESRLHLKVSGQLHWEEFAVKYIYCKLVNLLFGAFYDNDNLYYASIFSIWKNINEGPSTWSVKSIVDFFYIKNRRCIYELCINLQTQNFTVIEVCYKKRIFCHSCCTHIFMLKIDFPNLFKDCIWCIFTTTQHNGH